ncbi:hypothetical protein [Rhizobium halophytocola]|uniref:PepSY domain-containing protein n=1 Tax=Rhizobium halophytocola TaxID=735519 RepID=A0ABS4E614_9HYPH|nr:hypothetical protein [Rhizobium halophytocola]MBP1853356.1 hypothetical protein [Rhizobium halophytocola]
MVDREAAIETARRFLAARNHPPFDEATLFVERGIEDGRLVWIVIAGDALPESEDDWSQPHPSPVRYFIDAETGELFGFELERGHTILPP